MTRQFTARVTKDSLVFSAAHFITFNGNVCERLHGHNWRVDAAIIGELDENGYVYDFIALRDGLMQIVAELDHRLLLPAHHSAIHVEVSADEKEVTAGFEQRRWIVPREDAVILPIANTTAELIASWIGTTLIDRLGLRHVSTLCSLRISVEENFGQWADCVIPLSCESA
ncbi:MAG: 6-pyruvoyl tetrahydropterin synthase family protein [Planctomycetaceae bacterium]|nr:6-pyruvoyl tetrahydropterin synthase family protein [Planctomycetaceae bacterium]